MSVRACKQMLNKLKNVTKNAVANGAHILLYLLFRLQLFPPPLFYQT